MGVLMSVGGVVWSLLAALLGYLAAAIIPASYVVVTTGNLLWLDRGGRFALARRVQVAISMVLPFLFQLALGGFVASGAVMLWALLSLVASLAFQSPWRSAVTIAIFGALTVLSGMLDPLAAQWVGAATALDARSMLFVVINVVMVATIVGMLTTYLDALRQRHSDQQTEANRRIRTLNDALFSQLQRAEAAERDAIDANRAKSMFMANMSHELRTPLNAIIGYAELIGEESDEATQSDAERIERAGRHLLDLVNDVLDVAKIEAGKLVVDLEPVRLDAVVEELERTVRPLFASRGNRLRVHVDVRTCVQTDPRRVKQILINLLSNANKFTEGGSVGLSVTHADDALLLSVCDTGIGMTAEQVQRVREPFQQADVSTTRRYGGTGLGLHLVAQLAELLGGDLCIRSVLGQGTEVVVTLRAPASEAVTEAA